jgi:F0F1-type ATP synthase assembly protein I
VNLPSSFLPAVRAAALITQMAITVVIAAVAGAFVDRLLDSSPIMLMALSGVGFTVGMYLAWRGFSQVHDDPNENDSPR